MHYVCVQNIREIVQISIMEVMCTIIYAAKNDIVRKNIHRSIIGKQNTIKHVS